MQFLSKSIIPSGSKVFVRADLDVPLDKEGNILETFRLEALLPTLRLLLEQRTKPVLAGHIGRPKGNFDPVLSTQRLRPFFDYHLGKGSYEILENLRFHPGENAKSKGFAQNLSTQAEYYVNESFATCHRDTASIALLPSLLPSYVGLRLEEELYNLEKVTKDPKKPTVAVVGGIKESKKEAVYALAKFFDYVLVGGALKKTEDDPEATNVLYPLDYTESGLDIGLRTAIGYAKILDDAATVVWAGPMGAYDQGHPEGTRLIAEAIISSRVYSVVGGGDTITCLNMLELLEFFGFVSTGGGAMLDFLTRRKLPGLEALNYYA